MRKILLTAFLFAVLPGSVYASISINEIMYDLEGVDSGREWIEILNSSGEQVDLSGWKFYESGTNHGLNLFQGDPTISPGSYVIIADDASKFLLDSPNFSGTIFDSSFSLKNTGETLSIRDPDLNDIDQVSYIADWGGSGDGNSLQKISGSWVSGFPTPGAENIVSSPGDSEEQEQGGGTTGSSSTSWPVEPQIYANAGGDKVMIAGAPGEFEGKALGLLEEPLTNARYSWNFGDGTSKEGKKVLHTYQYPGDYIVFLNVSSGKFSASDRINIKVVESTIIISDVSASFYIELHNQSPYEINLSGWMLKTNGSHFSFPKDSVIGSNQKLKFSSTVTKLGFSFYDKVELLYPNGSVTDYFVKSDEVVGVIPEAGETKVVSTPLPPVEEFMVEKPLGSVNIVTATSMPANVIASAESGVSKGGMFAITLGLVVVASLGIIITRRFGI